MIARTPPHMPSPPPPMPDLRQPTALLDHVRHTLDFYRPRAFDPAGGFFHFLKDNGRVYDPHTRHLVSSTRYVFLWAMAARHFNEPQYLDYTRHALDFLHRAHRGADGGHAWLLDWRDGQARVLDGTHHAYGLAFVLLAHAQALAAGLGDAREGLESAYALMEQRFWEPASQLYADEADSHWHVRPYRGQNANMHATEACLAAFEATQDPRFLDRAAVLAESVVQRLTATTDGLIWEHYHEDWTVDWEYNRHDRSNIFRPWGYQPGHLTEWAKLLVMLERHRPLPWLLPRAQALYDAAFRLAEDHTHGGLYYGFAPDGSICDDGKYHWVQAETLAAAAVLGARTGEARYWDDYDRLWRYCWAHWVDHEHGAWFRILTHDNRAITDEKSPAGKVDYHTTGACYEILRALADARAPAAQAAG